MKKEMKKEYLLSIVVPTKNRYPYLKELVRLILSFNDDNIELVIEDNNEDNTSFLDFLKDLPMTNIKYYHEKEQIPLCLNSDRAILHSTGEYVCFIGDDDGVTRKITDCVRWMKSQNIDILKTQYALYKWPSYKDGKAMKLAGTLSLADTKMTYHKVSSKDSLINMIKEGFTSIANMPKVYNGIVKRSVLEIIYKKIGTYFPGPSPDMANAVALSLVSSNYTYLNFPIIIGGQCATVGGGARIVKGGYQKLSDQKILPKDSEDVWEKFLPKVWCVETVWPESGIKALKAMDAFDLLKHVNKEQLLSIFVAHRPWIKKMAIDLSDNPKIMLFKSKLYSFKIVCKNIKSIFKYKIQGRTPENLKIYRGINDIIEAESFIYSKYSQFPFL